MSEIKQIRKILEKKTSVDNGLNSLSNKNNNRNNIKFRNDNDTSSELELTNNSFNIKYNDKSSIEINDNEIKICNKVMKCDNILDVNNISATNIIANFLYTSNLSILNTLTSKSIECDTITSENIISDNISVLNNLVVSGEIVTNKLLANNINSKDSINIESNIINIGDSDSVVNINGNVINHKIYNTIINNKILYLNIDKYGNSIDEGNDSGIVIKGTYSDGYIKTNNDGTTFVIKAPLQTDYSYIGLIDKDNNLSITGNATFNKVITDSIVSNTISCNTIISDTVTGNNIIAENIKSNSCNIKNITSDTLESNNITVDECNVDSLLVKDIKTEKLQVSESISISNSITTSSIIANDTIETNIFNSNNISTINLFSSYIDSNEIKTDTISSNIIQSDNCHFDKIKVYNECNINGFCNINELLVQENIKAENIKAKIIESNTLIVNDNAVINTIKLSNSSSIYFDKLDLVNKVNINNLESNNIIADNITTDNITTNNIIYKGKNIENYICDNFNNIVNDNTLIDRIPLDKVIDNYSSIIYSCNVPKWTNIMSIDETKVDISSNIKFDNDLIEYFYRFYVKLENKYKKSRLMIQFKIKKKTNLNTFLFTIENATDDSDDIIYQESIVLDKNIGIDVDEIICVYFTLSDLDDPIISINLGKTLKEQIHEEGIVEIYDWKIYDQNGETYFYNSIKIEQDLECNANLIVNNNLQVKNNIVIDGDINCNNIICNNIDVYNDNADMIEHNHCDNITANNITTDTIYVNNIKSDNEIIINSSQITLGNYDADIHIYNLKTDNSNNDKINISSKSSIDIIGSVGSIIDDNDIRIDIYNDIINYRSNVKKVAHTISFDKNNMFSITKINDDIVYSKILTDKTTELSVINISADSLFANDVVSDIINGSTIETSNLIINDREEAGEAGEAGSNQSANIKAQNIIFVSNPPSLLQENKIDFQDNELVTKYYVDNYFDKNISYITSLNTLTVNNTGAINSLVSTSIKANNMESNNIKSNYAVVEKAKIENIEIKSLATIPTIKSHSIHSTFIECDNLNINDKIVFNNLMLTGNNDLYISGKTYIDNIETINISSSNNIQVKNNAIINNLDINNLNIKNSITFNKESNFNVNKISSNKITTNSIVVDKIRANNMDIDNLKVESISITAENIRGNNCSIYNLYSKDIKTDSMKCNNLFIDNECIYFYSKDYNNIKNGEIYSDENGYVKIKI